MPLVDLSLPFPIAGVDEVGRGPLAGPVTAAAVVLDPRRPVDGLTDSKALSEADRARLDAAIRRRALGFGLGEASVEEIDRLNILHASHLAMRRALAALAASLRAGGHPLTGLVVVDGDRVPGPPEGVGAPDRVDAGPARGRADGTAGGPAGGPADDAPARQVAVVGGDGRVAAVGAASIVAKVARDALMVRLHGTWPAFGFDGHKGYPTAAHRRALARHGPCPAHRRSFGPVRAALAARATTDHSAAAATPAATAGDAA